MFIVVSYGNRGDVSCVSRSVDGFRFGYSRADCRPLAKSMASLFGWVCFGEMENACYVRGSTLWLDRFLNDQAP